MTGILMVQWETDKRRARTQGLVLQQLPSVATFPYFSSTCLTLPSSSLLPPLVLIKLLAAVDNVLAILDPGRELLSIITSKVTR